MKASRDRSALADDEFWEQYLYRRLDRLVIQDGNEHFYRALSLKRKIMADGCQRRVKETGFRKVIVANDRNIFRYADPFFTQDLEGSHGHMIVGNHYRGELAVDF